MKNNKAIVLSAAALIAVAIVSAASTSAHAAIMGFGDFSNFTVNQNDAGSAPTISSGQIELTNGAAANETRSIFDNTPQTVSQFTASFTYQATGGNFALAPSAAFVLQNSSSGAHAVGLFNEGSGDFGFFQMANSDAISLQTGAPNGSTGLFTNGNIGGGGASLSPVNLDSGDPINVTLIYNGTTLAETLTDTTTSATFGTSYLANLDSALGGSTAFVGFTAATDGSSSPDQFISNFEFNANAVPEPSSIWLLAIGGGAALLVLGRRSRIARRFIKPNSLVV